MTEFFDNIKVLYKENAHFLNIVFGTAVFLLLFLMRNILSNAVSKLISKIVYKDESKRDALVNSIKKPLSTYIMLLGVFLGLTINIHSAAITKGFKIISILVICWGVTNVISSSFSNSLKDGKYSDDVINLTAVKFISKIFKILIIGLAVVMVISELGYNINGLITGLGVGGLAVSLAAQDAISNLISGFIIVFDKPFKVGEFIQTKDIMGTVLEVSMRTTKIRTLDDSVVTVPNSEITGGAIINISRKDKRLIETEIGLVYSTDNELLEKCINGIREYLINDDNIVPSPVRVEFEKFDDSSLIIYIFCYTYETDLDNYYSVLSNVNFNIKRIIEENGAKFAFPSSSIYIEKK